VEEEGAVGAGVQRWESRREWSEVRTAESQRGLKRGMVGWCHGDDE